MAQSLDVLGSLSLPSPQWATMCIINSTHSQWNFFASSKEVLWQLSLLANHQLQILQLQSAAIRLSPPFSFHHFPRLFFHKDLDLGILCPAKLWHNPLSCFYLEMLEWYNWSQEVMGFQRSVVNAALEQLLWLSFCSQSQILAIWAQYSTFSMQN